MGTASDLLEYTLRRAHNLPDLGAWDAVAQPFRLGRPVWGTLWVLYAGTSPTGRPSVRLQMSREKVGAGTAVVSTWMDWCVIDGSSLVGRTIQIVGVDAEFPALGAAPVSDGWAVPVCLAGVRWVRAFAAEVGDPASPGLLELVLVTREDR